MISVIISSYQDRYFENISTNIAATIGCEYEIIRIENRGIMSIAEAYNKGGVIAQYAITCFCHEDLIFHTNGWGNILIKLFNVTLNVGVIGVAGNKVFGNLPVAWFDYDYSNRVCNLIQHEKNEFSHIYIGFAENENLVNVEVLDGLFLCCKKSENLKFNGKINGFHAYDLAISQEAKKKHLRNFVTSEILIEHFSAGNINDEWYIDMHNFYQEYKNYLKKPTHYPAESLEAYKSFILGLHRLNYKRDAKKHFHRLLIIKPFDKFNLWYLLNLYFN